MHWKLYDIYIRQEKRLEAKRELEIILQIEPENLEAKKKMKGFLRYTQFADSHHSDNTLTKTEKTALRLLGEHLSNVSESLCQYG